MISMVILILGIVISLGGYLRLIGLYLKYRKIKYNKFSCEVVLDLLNDESSINLIESKDLVFSKYNIKRRMIKLTSDTYNSNNYYQVAVASLLSGFALSKNEYLEVIAKVFREIKIFSYSAIIGSIVALVVNNGVDAKIGIIILMVISGYQFIINLINSMAIEKVRISEDIKKIMNKFNSVNTMFFVGSLIYIVRFVTLLLGK